MKLEPHPLKTINHTNTPPPKTYTRLTIKLIHSTNKNPTTYNIEAYVLKHEFKKCFL